LLLLEFKDMQSGLDKQWLKQWRVVSLTNLSVASVCKQKVKMARYHHHQLP